MNKRVLERVVGDEDNAVVDIRGCDYGRLCGVCVIGVVPQTHVNTGRPSSHTGGPLPVDALLDARESGQYC
jgi:hypothetical protein